MIVSDKTVHSKSGKRKRLSFNSLRTLYTVQNLQKVYCTLYQECNLLCRQDRLQEFSDRFNP